MLTAPGRTAWPSLIPFVLTCLISTSACSSSKSPAAPSTQPAVTALTVSGALSMFVGQTSAFTATAVLASGATQTVTGVATWQSSNPAVATVSNSGVVTAVGPGAAVITATYRGQAGSLAVTATGAGGAATGRVVSALTPGAGVGGATVDADSLGRTMSDSSGYFTLVSTDQAKYTIRVTSPSWVDRQTMIKVPGQHADVSLIPDTFDLQFFNEMCRGFGGRLLRWTQAPVLVVETSVLEYFGKAATDERVPADFVDQAVEKLRRALSVLSAGRFPDFSSIERRTTAVGTVFSIPSGAVGLTWQRGLMTGFGHVAYGARSTMGAVDLTMGEVAMDADWHIRHLPQGSRTDYDNVLQHEFGHALGYSHTRIPPSFMYEVYLMDVSSKDREAFNIFFQRPSGNQAPDVDPSSSSLNFIGGATALVPIW